MSKPIKNILLHFVDIYKFKQYKKQNTLLDYLQDEQIIFLIIYISGKYVGNRPIKLRKSNWKDRNIDIVRKKEKEKKRLGLKQNHMYC